MPSPARPVQEHALATLVSLDVEHARPGRVLSLGYVVATFASLGLIGVSLREGSTLSTVEVLGFVTGGWCVWLVVRDNIWNWPVGIANAGFFVVVFWRARLYADATLQVIYIILGFLGWYMWLRGGQNHGRLRVRSVGRKEAAWVGVTFVVGTVIATFYLRSVGDSAPFLDALTTTLSLAAQYLLTRKFIESWTIWIVVDVIYVGLYVSRDLHLTGILYAVFLGMAIVGLKHWRSLLDHGPGSGEAPSLGSPAHARSSETGSALGASDA